MILSFKQLARWPRAVHEKRRALSGEAKFDVTRNELVARLLELQTTEAVVALDVNDAQMRPDGWPRANATPQSPGVVLIIDCRLGTLFLACDTYSHWLHNLHALALVLNGVRQASAHDVAPLQDFYAPLKWPGLSAWLAGAPFKEELSSVRISPLGKGKWAATTRTTGEWAGARPSEPPPPKTPPENPPPPPPKKPRSGSESFSTRAKAAAWLGEKTGLPAPALLSDERTFVEAYRQAARTMHPDVGGDPAQFRRLQNAKAVIERGAPWTK